MFFGCLEIFQTMDSKSKLSLVVILSIAFVSRLYFLLQDNIITTDGVRYALAGKSIFESGKYEVFGSPELIFSPGYPLLIGLADRFFNDLVFSAGFVSFVFGVLSIYLIYLVGKRMFGEGAGLFSALFAALNLNLITLSHTSMSESLFLFFILCIIWIFLKLHDIDKTWLRILLGAVIGFAYLVRIEGMIFLMFPIFLYAYRIKTLGIKKAIQGMVAVFIPFAIVVSFYVFFLYQHTGQVALTGKTNMNIMTGLIVEGRDLGSTSDKDVVSYEKVSGNYNEKENIVDTPEKYRNIDLLSLFLNNPGEFLKRYFTAAKSEIKILFFEYNLDILFILIVISLICLYRDRTKINNKGMLTLFILPAVLLAIFPLFHIEARYMVQVLIFCILLASAVYSIHPNAVTYELRGFVFSSEAILNVLRAIMVFSIVLQFIILYASDVVYANANYPIEHRLAGKFLKNSPEFNPETDRIMSRKPFVSFYSNSKVGGPTVPYTTLGNIIKFAKAKKVNYIVIDERYLSIRENYDELWRIGDHSDDLRLVFEDSSISPIRIFKVLYQ